MGGPPALGRLTSAGDVRPHRFPDPPVILILGEPGHADGAHKGSADAEGAAPAVAERILEAETASRSHEDHSVYSWAAGLHDRFRAPDPPIR